MAIFSPRTFQEIMKDMLARLIAATALSDVNYGSVWTMMLEAAAQEDDEQYFQMFQIILGYSIDTTTGTDLENRALEYGLTRDEAAKASTVINIEDTAITKVETGVYSGLSGAGAGTTTVNANDANDFPVSGSIIIGRNTPNVETIAYGSITVQPNYVVFNLSSALSKDHGTDETIILSQAGDRVISSGTVVIVPASDQLETVSFVTDAEAVVLDGEKEVLLVAVTAVEAGSTSNVPIGAISKFSALPFPTAKVSNPNRVTNGRDEETDQELRDKIKSTIQSLSRGTPQSVTTGVLGLVSEEDAKRVISVSLRDATVPTDVVKLFVDDGTGFVPSFSRIGFEEIVAAATGGERYLNTANFPLVKAFVETQDAEPYNIPNNGTLFVEVNGEAEVVTFVDSDFESPGSATAYEVLTKINASASLYECRLTEEGTKIKVFSRFNTAEQIQVTGGTANAALNFQTDIKYTSKLYLTRDNAVELLFKDGKTARIESGNTASYDFSDGLIHLSMVVDGRIDNIIDAWFDTGDFVNSAAANVLEVAAIFNARVPAITCEPSSNNTRVTLVSNTEKSTESQLQVLGDFSKCFNEEAGSNVDRTTEFSAAGSDVPIFAQDNDYIYLGHSDIPFKSAFVKLSTPSSDDLLPNFEYYKGGATLAFSELGVHDGTEGFTQDGHILFYPPYDWAKSLVEGVNAYWIRIQRTANTVTTPPVESRIKICGANDIFGFSEASVVGENSDYKLNRFMGQIELANTLQAGDRVTVGSDDTRASVTTSSVGNWSGLVGQTLTLYIEGVLQTVTFVSGDFSDVLAATPLEVAAAISAATVGLTASEITGVNKVKLQSNRITDGTIKIDDSGANSILDFPHVEVASLISHKPALESGLEDYAFSLNDFILVVIDDNLADNFTVPCFYESELTGVTSPSVLIDTALNPIFALDDAIKGFNLIMVDGTQVGQSAEVASYVAATGTITLATPLGGSPAPGDLFQVLPKTADEVVAFWNNTNISLLSTKAEIKESDAGRRVQMASKNFGEEASVIVTGGPGNSELAFSLSSRGVDGYRYYTGLAQQVQWTVDGKQDDLDNYSGLRAAGVQVEIEEPITVPVEIEIDVTTSEGITLATITNDIKSAISNYINLLNVSEDVILSSIINAASTVDGVFDVQVVAPESNIAIADNQLARIREDSITVG